MGRKMKARADVERAPGPNISMLYSYDPHPATAATPTVIIQDLNTSGAAIGAMHQPRKGSAPSHQEKLVGFSPAWIITAPTESEYATRTNMLTRSCGDFQSILTSPPSAAPVAPAHRGSRRTLVRPARH